MSINRPSNFIPGVDRETVLRLLEDLTPVRLEDRDRAIETLGQLDRLDVNRILEDLLKHPDPNTRCGAAEALFLLNSTSAVVLVLPLLRDSVDFVRWNVCHLLVDFADAQATEPLCEVLLNDPDSRVRFMAAMALGPIRDRRAIPALKQAYENDFGQDHEGDTVSKAAAISLTEIERSKT